MVLVGGAFNDLSTVARLAVTLLLTEQVALPLEMVQVMRSNQPLWGWLTGLAHTLP